MSPVLSLKAPEGWRSRLDLRLVVAVSILMSLGTLAVLSAASPLPNYHSIVQRHFMAFGIGIVAFLTGLVLNYQVYEDQSKSLYAVAIVTLFVVLVLGHLSKGHRAWIRFAAFSIQPVEIARIIMVLVLAAYLDRFQEKLGQFKYFLGALAVAGPIIVLVLKQPDLSSVLVMLPVLLTMLFCAGARLEHMAIVVGFGLVSAALPMLWTLLNLKAHWAMQSRVASFLLEIPRMRVAFLATMLGIWAAFAAVWWLFGNARIYLPWTVPAFGALVISVGLVSGILVDRHLKEYQRKRIEVFLDPASDPKGSSYNLLQAQIALGSGGIWGRGIFSGTQSKLGFLPERHTDFIFAVVGEEMGLWGSLSIMALYLVMIWRMVSAARSARDRFGYLVGAGFAASFGCYLLANTGMCLGFLPVAGLELPLVSYGGSNLVASLWALGIVESIYSRRYAFYQG